MSGEINSKQRLARNIVENVQRVIIGKPDAVELAVIGIMSQGHLLIEDAPGVGKTMLASSLARSVDCQFKRIQFTPDMLPGDITGVSIYNQKSGNFEFRPGPILAQMVLADEINRATPKVQSALLECMEEHQVTVDGVTHKITAPFHVLATQNPLEYEGTFPLPETQLDRFMLRIHLGYPSISDEIQIMERQQFKHPIESLAAVANAPDLLALQAAVKEVHVSDAVTGYIASITDATRRHPGIYLGASPRGSLSLFRTAQARALMQGRDFVLPDDVKAMARPVLAHRIVIHYRNGSKDHAGEVIGEILSNTTVPGWRPR